MPYSTFAAASRAYQKRRLMLAALVFATTGLLACTSTQPVSSVAVAEQWQPPENTTAWTVNREASELEVRVFSAGPLASFGHNHVIEFPVTGTLFRGATLADSGFRLAIPLGDAVVDDPGSRAASGEKFAQEISSQARSSTRANMLGDDLLAADRYPEIVIESLSMDGEADEVVANLRITLRDRSIEQQLSARLEERDDQFIVHASFSLTQTGLGLQQYTALGGGLKVRDDMEFKLHLVASRN